MKLFYSVLFSMLITAVSFSQQKKGKSKDTLKQKTIILNEVIIKGNLKTDPIFGTKTNDYIKKVIQPKNVADLFQGINGFSVIKRGNYAIDPTFRASQYEQLNIQYDGGVKAMHACPNRMDPITTHIIPEEIAQIEIIKGPYTVRYGATFGGIINMVTKKPNYEDPGFHGKVSTGYESNGGASVNMAQFQYIKEKYDIVLNAGYRNFGNYKDGNDIEIPSSFKSTDYGVKIGYNFSENERLYTHLRQSFGRDVIHAALPMNTEYDNSSVISLDYKLDNIGNNLKSFSAKGYYSYVDHLMTNKGRPSFMMMEASSPVEATTFGGKVEMKWQPNNNFTVFGGADLLHISRDGTRTRIVKVMNGNPLPMPMTFTDKIWQDSSISDVGLFSEAKWTTNETNVFTVGIRYDNVTSNIKDPEADFANMYTLGKRTEHNIGGTVSFKKQYSNNLTLEIAYGRGVRSANMVERFINHFNVGKDPYEYIGNPNLKAEINNQFEIGFKGFKRLKNNIKFTYEASVYYSFLENSIVAIVDPTLTRKFMPMAQPRNPKVFRNLNESYKTGLELAANFEFINGMYFNTQLAYVKSKNVDLNESLPLTPPLTSKMSLGYKKDNYWASLEYNITSKQSNIAQSFGETETKGYQTVDVRFGAKPFKNTTFGLAVLNITDEAYNNHLNFSFTNQAGFGRTPITEPGRNISLFLQYSF